MAQSGVGEGHDQALVVPEDNGEVAERAATLAGLAAAARGHAGRARAASTERGYAEDWTRFRLWCVDLDLEALPADALTVALYVAHLAPAWRPAGPDDPPEVVVAGEVCERAGLAPGSIARHLASIAVHHRAAGHPSPTRDSRVADVLSGVRRHPGVAPTRRVAAALTEQVQAMLVGLDAVHDPAAARDTALILLGYTAALRRSELAALTLADVTEHPDGAWIEVFLASSKTDQHRQGHTTRIPATGGPACPVAGWRLWRSWLTSSDHTRDEQTAGRLAPAFRRVRRGRPAVDGDRDTAARRIGQAALSDRSIAEIIKARAASAGLPGTWSGHSLRRGFATQAYTAGVDELAIMRHGRWRSAAVMRTYIAEADRHRTDSPINALGLEVPLQPPGREQRS
jgi:integrase